VLALKETGELIVFRHGSKDFEVLAEYEAADRPTWAHPALVDGRFLVIKDADSLTVWRFALVD
jgi:hypothetical protein